MAPEETPGAAIRVPPLLRRLVGTGSFAHDSDPHHVPARRERGKWLRRYSPVAFVLLVGTGLTWAVCAMALIHRPLSSLSIVLSAGVLCTLVLTAYAVQAARFTTRLVGQVAERNRVLSETNAALRQSEEKYRALVETTGTGFAMVDEHGTLLDANAQYVRMTGHGELHEILGHRVTEWIAPHDRERNQRAIAKCIQQGTVRNLEINHLDGRGGFVQVEISAMTLRTPTGVQVLGLIRDISERKRAQSKLEALQQQLLSASRQVGMAEVASGVLHNVGNVLNSLNVSATLVAEKVRASRVTRLAQVAALLRAHVDDWPAFAATDAKGRHLPGYLIQLAEHLAAEQAGVQQELDGLLKSVEHVKSIVGLQQRYARNRAAVEEISVRDLLDDVLQMHAAALARHRIQVGREYEDVPAVRTDRHTLLQILVNLVRNAKQALRESDQTERRLIVRVAPAEGERLRVEVRDNGVGISAADLTRIWEYGFTTKEDGHGLGLHHCALAAKALGGSLEASSDGPGQGATFVFELPLQVGEAAHV